MHGPPTSANHRSAAGTASSAGSSRASVLDDRGGVQRQLEGDAAAVGVADDVRPFHAQVGQEGAGVGRLPGDARLGAGGRAAGEAAPVVADDAVAVGQRRLGQQRGEGVGKEGAMDQQNRLPGSRDDVLEFHAVDGDPMPTPCRCPARAA